MRNPTAVELCEKYGNENTHTNHVTAIALRLFDAMQVPLGLSGKLRHELEAAAMLHDIAYRFDRRGHAAAGAQIIAAEGLAGFSRKSCRTIAEAVTLHKKSISASSIKNHRKITPDAIKIASFLRIADGLDHSHIQDASIVSVRKSHNIFYVTVRCKAYPANIIFAGIKADLWQLEFAPLKIRFRRTGAKNKKHSFAFAVSGRNSVVECARRLLFLLYRNIGDNREGFLLNEYPECLHDLRTALRRFRVCLKIFRKQIGKKRVKLLDLQVNTFSQAFGIVRDIDVWIEYLTEASGFMQGYPSFTRYLSSQKLRRIKCAAEAKEFLSSKEYSSLAQSISLFLRASIPDIIQQKSDANSAKFAAKAIERQLEKLSKLDADIPKNTDAAHSFRKICRKSRYTAEFLTSAAGCTSFLRLPADTKKMSAILGEIHDRDVGISLVSRCRWKGCTRLAAKLESERNALFKQAASCWSMIQRNYLLKGKAV